MICKSLKKCDTNFSHAGHQFMGMLLISIAVSGCFKMKSADLIIHNAKIYSVNENFTIYEAIAIKDGEIIDLGAEREILNRYRGKSMVDAGGSFVYPGFFDAHSHFTGYAHLKAELNLYEVESEQEMIEKVSVFAAKSSREWVVGRGWDHTKWRSGRYPDKERLDSLFPERPVYLSRIDGHAALVNQKALELAGIGKHFEMDGGYVQLDQSGMPTGMVLDNAADLVNNLISPLSIELRVQSIVAAQTDCFAAGLTTVTDAGISLATLYFLDSLSQAMTIQIGIYTLLRPGPEILNYMENGPFVSENVTARGVKLYADGALGSRGALLKRQYDDAPDEIGIDVFNDSLFEVYANACLKNHFQLCTHCIGDSANAVVLRKYAEKLRGVNDLRWRIEHAQVVDPVDQHYFKDFSIIPSMQPVHATSDMAWAANRLGTIRLQYAYGLETLREALGMVALGTDFPVENISPIENFYAAVFRKNKHGEPTDGFLMRDALSREDALRGITIWPAISSFEEHRKGSLEIGKQADFTILDQDLIKGSETAILNARVKKVFIKGVEMSF